MFLDAPDCQTLTYYIVKKKTINLRKKGVTKNIFFADMLAKLYIHVVISVKYNICIQLKKKKMRTWGLAPPKPPPAPLAELFH